MARFSFHCLHKLKIWCLEHWEEITETHVCLQTPGQLFFHWFMISNIFNVVIWTKFKHLFIADPLPSSTTPPPPQHFCTCALFHVASEHVSTSIISIGVYGVLAFDLITLTVPITENQLPNPFFFHTYPKWRPELTPQARVTFGRPFLDI